MSQPPEQELSRSQCKICQAHASGFHFGTQSCSACCAFFRRTVSLNRSYKCARQQINSSIIFSDGPCPISYTSTVICKACRYQKCLDVGMNKDAVKSCQQGPAASSPTSSPLLPKAKPKRQYWTKSGLKRNRHFAAVGISTVIKHVGNPGQTSLLPLPILESLSNLLEGTSQQQKRDSSSNSSSATIISVPPSTSSSSRRSTPPSSSGSSSRKRRRQITPLADDNRVSTKKQPSASAVSLACSIFPEGNILRVLIVEEMRIAERRRILFCERPVATLIGSQNTDCPFTQADIRPLRFQDFRKSIRTHILLIYEWLRVWTEYGNLSIEDQITLLRKSVLYHTILDPCYITFQLGDPTKFVLQNGGFVSSSSISGGKETEEEENGWEDEHEISQETKKKIYRPLLTPLREIVSQMKRLELRYEEFVALKALVSFQMAIPDVSQSCRELLRREIDVVCRSLFRFIQHFFAEDDQLSRAQRFGQIVLMPTTIFDTANFFVESHHQVQFFGLWEIDSLMLQFLKNKPY